MLKSSQDSSLCDQLNVILVQRPGLRLGDIWIEDLALRSFWLLEWQLS